jgi:hypothetical protein
MQIFSYWVFSCRLRAGDAQKPSPLHCNPPPDPHRSCACWLLTQFTLLTLASMSLWQLVGAGAHLGRVDGGVKLAAFKKSWEGPLWADHHESGPQLGPQSLAGWGGRLEKQAGPTLPHWRSGSLGKGLSAFWTGQVFQHASTPLSPALQSPSSVPVIGMGAPSTFVF